MLVDQINSDLIFRFFINAFAAFVLLFVFYYRRYRDKELVTTASMFNIFAFCVLTVLSSVQFSLALRRGSGCLRYSRCLACAQNKFQRLRLPIFSVQ